MASQLYAENGEGAGPRLNHERLCRQCVNNKARLLSLEVRMIRDHQFLMQQRSPEDGTGFWVGKKSYQKWRHLARSQLEDKIIDEVQHWKWQEEARLEVGCQTALGLVFTVRFLPGLPRGATASTSGDSATETEDAGDAR